MRIVSRFSARKWASEFLFSKNMFSSNFRETLLWNRVSWWPSITSRFFIVFMGCGLRNFHVGFWTRFQRAKKIRRQSPISVSTFLSTCTEETSFFCLFSYNRNEVHGQKFNFLPSQFAFSRRYSWIGLPLRQLANSCFANCQRPWQKKRSKVDANKATTQPKKY